MDGGVARFGAGGREGGQRHTRSIFPPADLDELLDIADLARHDEWGSEEVKVLSWVWRFGKELADMWKALFGWCVR